ncbi:helix-hairpin-helix domain-containing protein [bacterium]|nr:helix-hairpin-helix domain-containing protein [bacterium]
MNSRQTKNSRSSGKEERIRVDDLLTKTDKRVVVFIAAAIVVGNIFLYLNARNPGGFEGLLPDTTSVHKGSSDTTQDSKFPININTASKDELTLLPRIGEVLAGRIIEYRKAHGGFRRKEDITNVKGIGEKTYKILKPLITVD